MRISFSKISQTLKIDLYTHDLALIKVKSDRMLPNFTLVIATVQ